MIGSCQRDNSLDSSLEDEVVNDIPALLSAYPNIEKVAFTGNKEQVLFETHFSYPEIERVYLLSPSPAYAAMTFEEKVVQYAKKLGMER